MSRFAFLKSWRFWLKAVLVVVVAWIVLGYLKRHEYWPYTPATEVAETFDSPSDGTVDTVDLTKSPDVTPAVTPPEPVVTPVVTPTEPVVAPPVKDPCPKPAVVVNKAKKKEKKEKEEKVVVPPVVAPSPVEEPPASSSVGDVPPTSLVSDEPVLQQRPYVNVTVETVTTMPGLSTYSKTTHVSGSGGFSYTETTHNETRK
jgi:hypothetical protein